jgi:hypothetical protein
MADHDGVRVALDYIFSFTLNRGQRPSQETHARGPRDPACPSEPLGAFRSVLAGEPFRDIDLVSV